MWTCSTALHMETLKGSFEHAAKTKEAGSSPLLFSLHRETHRPGRFFVTAVPARVIEWCWEMKFFFPQMVILVEWAAKLCCYSFSPFLFFLSSCLLPLCMQILTCVFMRPDVKFRQFPLQLYTWVLETGLIMEPRAHHFNQWALKNHHSLCFTVLGWWVCSALLDLDMGS